MATGFSHSFAYYLNLLMNWMSWRVVLNELKSWIYYNYNYHNYMILVTFKDEYKFHLNFSLHNYNLFPILSSHEKTHNESQLFDKNIYNWSL